jgi:hypothetical protein
MARAQHWRRVGAIAAVVAVAVIATYRVREAKPVAPVVSLPSGEQQRSPDAPKIEVVPKPSVTARVTKGGAPVPDIEVSITDGSTPVLAHAWTDREGLVRFDDLPRGPFELWATGDAMASAQVRVEDSATVELAMETAANVRGQITADGFVPPNSTVTLVPLDGDHAARIASVDDTGRFAIEGVPLGRWRVESDVPGHFADPIFTRVAENETEIAVKVVRVGAVSGIVVDSQGTPVPHATIVLRDQSGATTQRPLSLASTGLRWVHPLAEKRLQPVIEPARFSASRPGARPTECGRGHCGIDIGTVRGSIVHAAADGEVVSIFPEPRTEAGKVVAIHHGGGLKSFYMHLDEIRPGLEIGQTVRAGEPVGTLGSTGFTRNASAPHVHFAITHEHRGRTWYLDPEPILRHAVVLPAARSYEPFEPSTTKDPLAATPVVERITTDAKGMFRVDGMAPGNYVAGVFASDYAPGASGPFAIRSGEDTLDLRVVLDAGIAVRGVVVGPGGAIAGATVMAGAGFGETAHKIGTTVTDKTGRFTLRALSGKVTITVHAPQYGEQERTLVVDDKTKEQRFDLTIENARLRGQVLAADGGAAAGVVVRIVDGPTTRKRAVTDAQGTFTMMVASGKYVVELTSPEFPAKRIDMESETWREVRLELGGGARVLVRDAQATAPLANVRVELAGPNGASANRTTNASGVVEVRGLVPGEWRVAARAAGFTAASQNVTIRAERVPKDVALELSRAATIAGTVRDRYGRRVAGARVSIGSSSTKTDAEGNFKIADAPVGAGVVEAEFEGTRGALAVELAPGGERVALTIELQ